MGKKLKIEIPFDDVWERIRQVTKWGTYTDLANFLSISSSSITGAKDRGNWPIEWAFKIAQVYNVSIDWLLTGEGEMRRGERAAPEYVAAYIPRSADPRLSALVEKLECVYKEGDMKEKALVRGLIEELYDEVCTPGKKDIKGAKAA